MPTTFHLARTPQHFKNIYTFLREQGVYTKGERLIDPTIYGLRDGELIAVMGRYPDKKAVIVGEMAVKLGANRAMLVLKMLEVWDALMVRLGVTEYLAPLPKEGSRFLPLVVRIIGEPFAEDDRFFWFKRRLLDG